MLTIIWSTGLNCCSTAAQLKRRVHLPKDTSRDTLYPRCGATLRAASHRAKYCPGCRPEAVREYQREWKRRRKAEPHLRTKHPDAVARIDGTSSGGEDTPGE